MLDTLAPTDYHFLLVISISKSLIALQTDMGRAIRSSDRSKYSTSMYVSVTVVCSVVCIKTVVVLLTKPRVKSGIISSRVVQRGNYLLRHDPHHRRRKDMTTQQAIDIAKVQAFMGKVMGDSASA